MSLPEAETQPKLRALVIDDKRSVRLFLSNLLVKRFRAEVSEAENGLVGLMKIIECPPDLVFIDLSMPVMNGVEVVESLREDPKFRNLPVIVLTASDDRTKVKRLAELGVLDYILKPLDFYTSVQRLRNIIDNVINPARAANLAAPSAVNKSQRIKVLLVDSDASFLEFFKQNFPENYEVIAVESSIEGLKNFTELKPLVVIIGKGMSVFLIEAAFSKMKEMTQNPNSKIYYCGESTDELRETGLHFDGFIKKTFVPPTFKEEIRRILLPREGEERFIFDMLSIRHNGITSVMKKVFGELHFMDISLHRTLSRDEKEYFAMHCLENPSGKYLKHYFGKLSSDKKSLLDFCERTQRPSATNDETLRNLLQETLETICVGLCTSFQKETGEEFTTSHLDDAKMSLLTEITEIVKYDITVLENQTFTFALYSASLKNN